MSFSSRFRMSTAAAMATILTAGTLALTPGTSLAVGTTLFNQPFHNNTANGVGAVVLPDTAPATGGNVACLTAAGNPTTGPLLSCPTSTDPQGAGKLRLTSATANQIGGVFSAASVPTSQGLDITFNTYQYGGNADGLAFVLAAVDPANPRSPAIMGRGGGSLGYSAAFNGNTLGLSNGYMGIGFDVFGNFSSSSYQGTGCTNPPYISTTARVPGQVVVRGPGHDRVGYCAINSTAATTASPPLALGAVTRAASQVPVEVVINPTGAAFTTGSGISVPAGEYRIRFTPVGGAAMTLSGGLPTVAASFYPSPSWVNANGIPRQLAFGWVASTGSVFAFHEIDNAAATTFTAVPDLNVTQTSYTGPTPQPGDPVNYSITAGVDPGVAETAPISVTQTTPAGVVPLGAFGSGWVCGTPVGQSITCLNSNGPFAAGSSLPPISVVAIVTGAGVTPALIQTATVATSSSTDANPGYSSSTTPVAPPPTPSGITVTPALSSVAGGIPVTVGGTNIAGATAIEIGTTAEQQAGTPVTLLPCQSGPAAGCFTVNGDGTLAISSMPARASAGAVNVTVVTRGVAASTSYVYAAAPAAPAAPTATAGITSATVSWTAPADNGSPITGYVVTPIRNGIAQPTQSFDASTTTRTLAGLTAGASYTFRVAAVNAFGTGANSPPSNAVIPYTVPAAPTITAVSAGSNAATLSWNAPSNGGSAITSYVVTPYIGGVPQPAQTFPAGSTTRTVTGLTAGTTYTFRVAATNAAGTGPASAASAPVTINASPSLNFPPPPPGEVGAAYSDQLTVTGGTAPFAWSISAGSLPPGVTLNPSTGLLSGTPTTAGSFSFTVQVADASDLTASRAATIVIAPPPSLTFPPPPPGEANVVYSDQLTVTGGTGPFTWSISAGALPPGLSLNTGTGLLSGIPSAAGSFGFTVRIVDSFGQSDTRPATLVIRQTATLTLTSSTTTVSFGTPVTFTATAGPAPATGTVTFTAVSATGNTVTLGTVPLSGNIATLTVALPAFNTNTVTARYGGDATHGTATSNPVTVQVSATLGELIIDQFRFSGPGGAGDQYVQLYNTGPAMPLAGFTIASATGASLTLPQDAPTLPTGRSYLVAAAGYSLSTVASPDLSTGALGGGGLKISAPDAAATVTDAVGSTGAGFYSGTPLPTLTGVPTNQYAWDRLTTAGRPANTQNNNADFKLISTTATPVGGVPSALGTPAPQNTASPYQQNAVLQSTLLAPTVAANATPNQTYVPGTGGNPGTLTVRRTITNRSATATMTTTRLRITSLSETNGAPRPGVPVQPANPAHLRIVAPATPTSSVTIPGSGTVTVQNLSVDAPAGAPGGGLGSTLTVPLPGGTLAPGESVHIALTFAVDQGGTFWFGYNVDALSTEPGLATRTKTAAPGHQTRLAPPAGRAGAAGRV
ncbi:fibronectin type III domain-containing protein [Micromonospora sp. NPDC023888]|uniref:fibronectin type III domain-containing protein n=1 Tax=Micromonospora sp. NPDC023888 TaxID=3155607 RepID=UPI003401E60D